MTDDMLLLVDEMEENMQKAQEAMKNDFSAIRTGKASPALVENITVEYYGAKSRIRDIAGIATPEARLITIQPWDQSAVKLIEKAIQESNLGISPVSDGRVIRLPIPPLSQERRLTLGKQVKSRAEEARVAVRNIRRDGNDAFKKLKGSDISEDEIKDLEDDLQKMTDKYIKKIDGAVEVKTKEVMTV